MNMVASDPPDFDAELGGGGGRVAELAHGVAEGGFNAQIQQPYAQGFIL